MMTNISKSLNSMLVVVRECLISTLFDSIFYRFANLFREKHNKVNSKNKFIPIIDKNIREKMTKENSLYVNNLYRD